MKILEELYYGNISTNEKRVPPDSELSILMDTVCKNDTRIKEMLSEEQVEKYNIYKETESEMHSEFRCKAFINGFKLGLRMAVESFTDDFE